ncbi:alpha/beta fold hydrolase [Subtercola endophyticus]|uniref:alpha/beta fold hydrolase n=1 Tax=Subtercola endophyticus TaxID=2895559 RepID=UPI001E2C1245|nr:alpha/beta fold hydrolase [Subtercola endophyticus]UFS60159.1 alpha/beta hydrolase [Subtercola endophyticus]
MTYLTYDIPVAGGPLRVGEWRPENTTESAGDAPVILALHGMTGSHLSWQFLAAEFAEARIIAPDLRGRGLSAELAEPYGIAQHVADVRAIVEALRLDSGDHRRDLVIVGHSLGAFVGLSVLRAMPSVFSRAFFADGGLPLTVPLNIDDVDLVEAVLGLAVARRTELTFTSKALYRKFWRLHPGLAAAWSERLGLMADYDLVEILAADGSLRYRPVSRREAIEADARELYGSHAIRELLTGFGEGGADAPTISVLTAPRGLLNEAPGVYSESELAGWKSEFPFITFVEVPNVNHYSLVLAAKGASAIAAELRRALACV